MRLSLLTLALAAWVTSATVHGLDRDVGAVLLMTGTHFTGIDKPIAMFMSLEGPRDQPASVCDAT